MEPSIEAWKKPNGDGIVYLDFDRDGIARVTREALHQLLLTSGWAMGTDHGPKTANLPHGAECPKCGEPVIVGSAAQIAARALLEAADQMPSTLETAVGARAWLRNEAREIWVNEIWDNE